MRWFCCWVIKHINTKEGGGKYGFNEREGGWRCDDGNYKRVD
jgi:hypothetical protein